MEDKRITAEEILAEIDIDVNQMAQKVAGGRQLHQQEQIQQKI
jgi:hypothetical protein